MSKKILLSGIQPSGKPHIGNYFGMIRQLLGQQDEYEVYALGLNPKKVTFFKQSDVSEHTELCWIFDTMITMPYLMRAHAFKDAQMKNKEIDVGTFNYPVLMAADILLYGPDLIPVGADQKQHVEIARDIAEKFNRTYGEGGQFFKLPEAMIMKDVAIVPGTDGRKMSKSYNNTIPLFAEYEEIKKCVMSIVTDSSEGIPKNVYAIHNLLRPASELLPLYESKAGKYKELKELLIEDLEKFIAPLRKRRKEFEKDLPKALAILKQGGEKAKKIAAKKMEEVREKIGVNVY